MIGRAWQLIIIQSLLFLISTLILYDNTHRCSSFCFFIISLVGYLISLATHTDTYINTHTLSHIHLLLCAKPLFLILSHSESLWWRRLGFGSGWQSLAGKAELVIWDGQIKVMWGRTETQQTERGAERLNRTKLAASLVPTSKSMVTWSPFFTFMSSFHFLLLPVQAQMIGNWHEMNFCLRSLGTVPVWNFTSSHQETQAGSSCLLASYTRKVFFLFFLSFFSNPDTWIPECCQMSHCWLTLPMGNAQDILRMLLLLLIMMLNFYHSTTGAAALFCPP